MLEKRLQAESKVGDPENAKREGGEASRKF